eukprot:1156081-Pelagomonas_calceolata.AAC.14
MVVDARAVWHILYVAHSFISGQAFEYCWKSICDVACTSSIGSTTWGAPCSCHTSRRSRMAYKDTLSPVASRWRSRPNTIATCGPMRPCWWLCSPNGKSLSAWPRRKVKEKQLIQNRLCPSMKYEQLTHKIVSTEENERQLSAAEISMDSPEAESGRHCAFWKDSLRHLTRHTNIRHADVFSFRRCIQKQFYLMLIRKKDYSM